MTVIEQDPGDATHGGGQVGDDAGHSGTQVGRESRATVEAKPAEPDENGANDDVAHAVGTEVLLVTGTSAQDNGVREGSSAGTNVNRRAAGKVEAAHDKAPAVGAPSPAGDKVVDKGAPEENEDQGGHDAAALGGSADGQGGC